MARTGLYKSEVKKARDALISQGKHPSVDAVRIALGNTGSKTTIHKYLKELEEEDGGASGRKASISETLHDLVERLAAQLQDEATAKIDAVRTEHAQQTHAQAETIATLEKALAAAKGQQQRLTATLQEERAAHDRIRETLQQETVARHTSEQHAADLKERLAENVAHRQSLEEKHQHAREALEHYRQSVKEQRDQDLRRHEQQIQQLQAELRTVQQTIVVKQEEVTRLNQEGARLVTDLSHSQKALHDQEENGRRLAIKVEALHAVEQRAGILASQLADRETHLADLKQQLAASTLTIESQASQLQTTKLELASAQASLIAQQNVVADLRAAMVPRTADGSGTTA